MKLKNRLKTIERKKLVWNGEESLYHLRRTKFLPQTSIDGLEETEKKCQTHVLVLVVHGGNILDPAGGDPSAKAADVNTLSSVLDKVSEAHYQAAAQHVVIKLVPCPAVCAEAFSLVSNLNPYSYDESCVSSSVDHLPLAALPLLAIASPHYQDAVATVIARTNQVYHSFLQSPEGQGFTGRVCLLGDCVGGVLCFDALCFSNSPRHSSPVHNSRHNSMESLKDNTEVSPRLNSSKRLSRSNVDLSAPSESRSRTGPLRRKQSDSLDGDSQHHLFFSSLIQDGTDLRPGSSTSLVLNPGRFDFEVSDCFLLGCPLGLVLAMRRTVLPAVQVSQLRPACSQIFNLFYPSDPSASRLEPLLHSQFHKLPPFPVSRYQRYPLGDGRSNLVGSSGHLKVTLSRFSLTPNTEQSAGGRVGGEVRRSSLTSMDSQVSGCSERRLSSTIANITSTWWGSKRLDYALYCPDVLTTFPTVALPHLFHASYWESTDVVAFLLRQVMHCDFVKTQQKYNTDSAPFSPSSPREKWLRRRTHVKLRVSTSHTPSHNYACLLNRNWILVALYSHGSHGGVQVSGIAVPVFVKMLHSNSRSFYYTASLLACTAQVTRRTEANIDLYNSVSRVNDVITTEDGPQTLVGRFIFCLPKEFLVSSLASTGSFAASVSIMGSDPKVRPGAVDVVRHWQDLGYLIIYITGRPDMQKQRVVSWLSQHNFPQGMIFFSEGLVHDPLRQKAIFLRNLVQECHIKINCAYGSMKDISVYSMLGLSPNQIYIVGRPSKKYQNQCQFLSEGYAVHLSSLQFSHRARPKKTSSVRMVLRKGSFGLSAKPDFLCKRTHLRRTMSVQQPDPPITANPKPERAQSQPESDKDPGGGGGVGHGVWARGSMHRGDTTP
ncbi:Membrane-associated phosphatidylinositol transfer protein 3 [Triplophysa tibetana]|uniref:Membrane-associated phosphatidylinositol transfer protein 3 n=1 Tax=Triplophysa tibetana TaxID=1572043 RepID=A0A5A9MZI0_9TELE|nr:Membrane-associated phosphatidylinositol transfer protein 3 [Triplophysa tibetana]